MKMMYNETEEERRPRNIMMNHAPGRRNRRRRKRFGVWNIIVLAIGYATIGYQLVRLIIFLLALLSGNQQMELH